MTTPETATTPPFFKDYADFNAHNLVLTINGKPYTIPEVGIKTAAALHGVSAGKEQPSEWGVQDTFYRSVLGAAYGQMFDDDVPAGSVQRAVQTVWTDVVRGRAAAMVMWEVGSDPEAMAAWEAAQQTASSPASVDPSTPDQGSPSSGTTNPDADTTPSSPKPKRVSPPRGRKSSTSGARSKPTSKGSTA